MANGAINNSANIFLQGGQMYQNANRSIFDAISQAADAYDARMRQREALLAAERQKAAERAAEAAKEAMKPENILAQAIQGGVENLTPEQRAVFQADQMMQGSKVALDPLGRAYKPYDPISLEGLASRGGQGPVIQNWQELGGQGLSPVPAAGNEGATPSEFFSQLAAPQEAPAPIGSEVKTQKPTKFDMPKSSNPVASSPAGDMKRYEKELDFYSQKLMKDYDKGLDVEAEGKSKNLAQMALTRMNEINETLKEKGVIVSGDGSRKDNLGAMARGFNIPVPFTEGVDVGGIGEKALDPKTKALREEYKRLRSTLLPFYAKASGLGAKSLDSNAERESMLDSFGDPNGVYESNQKQLETLSKMIGTGSLAKGDDKAEVKTKPFGEGQTATNPKTGEKMIFKGGSWQKM